MSWGDRNRPRTPIPAPPRPARVTGEAAALRRHARCEDVRRTCHQRCRRALTTRSRADASTRRTGPPRRIASAIGPEPAAGRGP
ncbi:hypothetical protein ACFPM0_20060 [Pseudonocardia sulfidoxydans]|uniref:hypothetical protein n=1 Tax=Pseudonocardia sulfidoxydans TaxID=54011 RepID=UPI00360F235F